MSLVDLAMLTRRTLHTNGVGSRCATADAPAFAPHGTLIVKQAHGLTDVTP